MVTGSGEVLISTRVPALVKWLVAATPPPSPRDAANSTAWLTSSPSATPAAMMAPAGMRDEGVDGVPAAVDAGRLVGEELEEIHDARNAEHQGVLQHLERRREGGVSGIGQNAEHQHGGVEIDSGGPGSAEGEGDGVDGIHSVSSVR